MIGANLDVERFNVHPNRWDNVRAMAVEEGVEIVDCRG
jgi:hypothetical protein